jgi:hypothetical protein
MKHARLALSALAFVLLCSASSLATTPPAGAPAGTTGLCNDGTYTNFATKSGACAGHKGVKTWYGPAAAPKSTTKPTTTASKPATTTPPPAAGSSTTTKPSLLSKLTSKSSTPAPAGSSPAPAPASTPSKPAPAAGSTGGAPAAGGGPGMVWVNTSTKVYHCPTDRYYGKTKNGQYLTEAAAQAAGDKPDAGKKCF